MAGYIGESNVEINYKGPVNVSDGAQMSGTNVHFHEAPGRAQSEDRELSKLIQKLELIETGQLGAAEAGDVARRLNLLRLISSTDADSVDYAVSKAKYQCNF